jgi:hypothetical protein|tara:strand:+ start:64 stop:240 length:177 start_codon:yes stop_codon:yes gene_type:complete
MKQAVIKDLEELKRLGVDTSKTISRVKKGDFDEDIELYSECMMKVHEISDLLRNLTGE